MESLRELFKKRRITISLRIFDEHDLANGWEVKAIVDNPDIFVDFYKKYPLQEIETFDDYYLYLFSIKLSSMARIIPQLLHEEHKIMIDRLASGANDALNVIGAGSAIRFINAHFNELFDKEVTSHDIRYVTLDYIEKYVSGINTTVLYFLCENYGYLLIDRFDSFERIFEVTPDLFAKLFPSGKLAEIDPFRFEKVLDIWSHILNKKNSHLKEIVTCNLSVLYEDIKKLSESATIDNIMQIEGIIRQFYSFLQKIQSPKANEFLIYAKSAEDLLGCYLNERGQSFQYEIPIGDIVEDWKKKSNWVYRLLSLSHDVSFIDNSINVASQISFAPEPSQSIIDFVSTNVPTDGFFTMSHQQKLSITASVATGLFVGVLRSPDTFQDYQKLVFSAMNHISKAIKAEGEHLEQDVEHLLSMIQLVVDNSDAEENVIHALCYSASMYICALIDKLLRITYMHLVRDEMYVPINKATMGELLNVGNAHMVDLLGESHILNLSFFLLQVTPKRIGHNYRNSLAHWSSISADSLTPTFVAQLLWLFTDILNSVFWYFSKNEIEGEPKDDQL